MLSNVQCHRYLYPHHSIENTGPYNWKHRWNQTVSNHPIHQHGHTNFWYLCFLKEFILISKNVAIMCGMYIINGVHRPKPRSSGGNTSSSTQVSALIPRPAFNWMERMCQRHGSNQNSHPPDLVRKPSYNQFIHNHISSRWVFGIKYFKLRNFAIECSFATLDRGSIMARIHRWSMMVYDSLQAEFMETKYNSHIHMNGTSVFGKIVVNIFKSINNNNQIFWRL